MGCFKNLGPTLSLHLVPGPHSQNGPLSVLMLQFVSSNSRHLAMRELLQHWNFGKTICYNTSLHCMCRLHAFERPVDHKKRHTWCEGWEVRTWHLKRWDKASLPCHIRFIFRTWFCKQQSQPESLLKLLLQFSRTKMCGLSHCVIWFDVFRVPNVVEPQSLPSVYIKDDYHAIFHNSHYDCIRYPTRVAWDHTNFISS